jgi:hypothetical protein
MLEDSTEARVQQRRQRPAGRNCSRGLPVSHFGPNTGGSARGFALPFSRTLALLIPMTPRFSGGRFSALRASHWKDARFLGTDRAFA